MTKWHVQPTSSARTPPPDHLRTILSCEGNTANLNAHFRNDKVVWCKLYPIKGTIGNYIQTDDNPVDHARVVLEKYQAYSGAEYIHPLLNTLDSIGELKNSSSIIGKGSTIMKTDIYDNRPKTEDIRQTFEWTHTMNGIANTYSSLVITFHNGAFEFFCDNWNRYPFYAGELNISRERAIGLAQEAATNKLILTVGREVAANYTFVHGGARLEMQVRSGVLVPEWWVGLTFDKIGKINSTSQFAVRAALWADTGELGLIEEPWSWDFVSMKTPLPQQSSAPQTPTLTISPSDNYNRSTVNFGLMVAVTVIALAVGVAEILRKLRRQ